MENPSLRQRLNSYTITKYMFNSCFSVLRYITCMKLLFVHFMTTEDFFQDFIDWLIFQKPDRDFEIENDGVPFLYRMVGTWGFSPHPARWVQLLTWFNSLDSETFDPYVPGKKLIISKLICKWVLNLKNF